MLRLYKAWLDGEEMIDISERFGRSPNAIRQQLHQGGVKRSSEKISEVRRLAGRKKGDSYSGA